MTNLLATGNVQSQLSGVPGRAIVSARAHHAIVDSPLPLGGPNEELNPVDLLLGALATCATFVCETIAGEQEIPLTTITATVEGDFDPRGVCGDPVDPRIQTFRVKLTMSGPTEEQTQMLVRAFQQRCPIYTTLSRSAPIEIDIDISLNDPVNEGVEMMKRIRCQDLGFDCDHEVEAQTEEELLQRVADHAEKVHDLEVTPELVEQVKSKIRES